MADGPNYAVSRPYAERSRAEPKFWAPPPYVVPASALPPEPFLGVAFERALASSWSRPGALPNRALFKLDYMIYRINLTQKNTKSTDVLINN